MKPVFIHGLKYSVIILAVYYFSVAAWAAQVQTQLQNVPQLIKTLQSGGHIIYMRHGATDHSQKDSNRSDFTNCKTQRNLSEQGIHESTKIAQAIKSLAIPIGKVFSSPYCRAKDTAGIIYKHTIIIDDLQFSISKNQQDSERLGKRLYEMMRETNDEKNNTVFISHTSNLRDGLGIWPKPEGVAVILKKNSTGLIYKGMITPDAWPE